MFIILSPTRDSNPEKPGLSGNPLAPAIRRRNSAAAIHREPQNSLPDGVWEDNQAPPVYGDGALSDNPDISHSMPPLYALYSSSVIPIETR